MATWPSTLPAPQKNIGIVPGDTRIDRKLQSGRTEFRRFGDGKPDQIKALFRLTWAEWDTFKEFHAHDLNLGINWFSADWIADLGYDAHNARILGYPREVALQNYYVDVLCNLIIQATADIVTEDTVWPCEPGGAEPPEPEPGPEGYIIGGYVHPGGIRDCDRYTQETDSWANRADIPLPARHALAASTIASSIYSYCGDGALLDCDEYTPNAWVSKTNALLARKNHAASTIGSSGYVYGNYNSVDCDRYTPVGDSWASMANFPSPGRVYLAASTISNKGYIYAGLTYLAAYLQDCDEYDPNFDTWASKTNMPLPARYWLAASTIGSAGYVYGGAGAGNDCDEYIAAGDVWASMTDMPGTYRMAAATIGSAGYIYDTDTGCNRFAGNAWTSMANYPAPARHSLVASTL